MQYAIFVTMYIPANPKPRTQKRVLIMEDENAANKLAAELKAQSVPRRHVIDAHVGQVVEFGSSTARQFIYDWKTN